jgi:hypothetical protein
MASASFFSKAQAREPDKTTKKKRADTQELIFLLSIQNMRLSRRLSPDVTFEKKPSSSPIPLLEMTEAAAHFFSFMRPDFC